MRARMRSWLLLAISVTSLGLVHDQAQETTWLRVFDARGESRVGTGAKAEKPPVPTRGPGNNAVFFHDNHTVRDERGRVVSGLSFQAWLDGSGVRVAVYTLVPGPDAPNTYLAGRGTLGQLRPVTLVEFSMEVGATRRLTELERLGLEPWTLKVEKGPR